MIIDDLLHFAAPIRDPIRNSGRHLRHEVETRLDVSARHLSTAELGRQLEPAWHRDEAAFAAVMATDHATLITAAQTLVFGGSLACLDLCASAVVHWHGIGASNDRDFDLGDLTAARLRQLGITLEPWATQWRDRTKGDSRYPLLDAFRGAQLHRIVRRSSTAYPNTVAMAVQVGEQAVPHSEPELQTPPASWLSASSSVEPNQPVEDIYATVLEFTDWAWREFWAAIAANA